MGFKQNTAADLYFVGVHSSTGAPTAGLSWSKYLTVDGGAQGAANGTITNLGNGQYRFAGTAADFNGLEVGLMFTAASTIPVSFSVKTDTKIVSELNDFDAAADEVALVTTTTTVSNEVTADITKISGGTAEADRLQAALGTGNYIAADLQFILNHQLTDTGTQLADGFQKFFDVASPTGTVNSLPDAIPGNSNALITSVTGSSTNTYDGIYTAVVTDIPGTITTAQNDLDTITGTAGVLIGTDAMDRSGTLDVNTKALAGTAQDATDLADFAAEGYDPATNKVQGVVLCDTITTYTGNTLQTADVAALNDIAAADVWAVDATTQQTQGTFGQAIGDPVADATTIYQSVATDAQGDNVAVDVAAAVGTDGLCLISTDAQDLSATLDVNTKTITNGIIVAATLGADCITEAKIADDAIAAEHIATGAIVAATFAANAITSTVVADNTITAAKINADAITAAKIADNAISSEHLATGAIVAATFAANAITSTVVADNTLTAAKINADAITAAKIADDAFVAANFATGALTADAFAANALIAATFAADYLAAITAAADAALATTTYAEPGVGPPAATASLEDKIGYLYKNWRNKKIQSATEFDLYNDAGDTIDQQAAVSDNGTIATKEEMGTGA